jgi:hypothetical protein
MVHSIPLDRTAPAIPAFPSKANGAGILSVDYLDLDTRRIYHRVPETSAVRWHHAANILEARQGIGHTIHRLRETGQFDGCCIAILGVFVSMMSLN